jgi:hypothetical protein
MTEQTERNAEIRRRLQAGERPADLARDYGVTPTRIAEIARTAERRSKEHHPDYVHLRLVDRAQKLDYIVWKGWRKIGRVYREGGRDTVRGRLQPFRYWGWVAFMPAPWSDGWMAIQDETDKSLPATLREPKLFKTRKAAVEAILERTR